MPSGVAEPATTNHNPARSPMLKAIAVFPRRLVWRWLFLFLHDDPLVVERVVRYAMEQYSQTEEQVRSGFFGSVDDVRAAVRRQVEEGADSINLFQLPRVHTQSLLRFSEDVIPQFR